MVASRRGAEKKNPHCCVMLIGASSFAPRQRDACDVDDCRRRPTAKQRMVLEISISSDDAQKGNRAGYFAGKVCVAKSC